MEAPDKILEKIIIGLNQKTSDPDYKDYFLNQSNQIEEIKKRIIAQGFVKQCFELAEQYAKVAKIAYESGELEKSRYFKNEAISVLIEGMKRLGYKIERAT